MEDLITAKQLGLEIRRRRKARGWTLEEVGSRVGISLKTISDYESGNSVPSLQSYFKLCRVFEMGKIPFISSAEKTIT